MKNKNLSPAAVTVILLLFPVLATAHTGFGVTPGFLSGAGHPVGGLDHLLAMVAVGLWAAQMGGRGVWLVPAVFVGVMAVGGAIGAGGVGLPFVEPGILLSVIVLGGLVAVAAATMPLAAGAALVGLFALFHGHAHGTEMPLDVSGAAYGAGFVLSTALLHATGLGLGVTMRRVANERWVQAAGAAVVLLGVGLWMG